jgi:2-polyprenyl-3-methyl-5-hydroxy-6-metoxy-1,4-benzoquinol methylase
MEQCPICHSCNNKIHLLAQDWLITKKEFPIIRCINCGHLFTGNAPIGKELSSYYESDKYTSHTDKATEGKIYNIAKTLNITLKCRLIQKHIEHPKHILDYGCGTGDFLGFCEKRTKMVAYGYDPSEKAIKQLRTKYNFTIHNNHNAILQNKYDIITLWHVVEHLPDPIKTIELLVQSLNSTGLLIIAMPNHSSYDSIFYKDKWAAYDVPRHLHHFTPNLLVNSLKNLDIQLKEISFLPIDPFYISYLSEKQISSYLPYSIRLLQSTTISIISSVLSVIKPTHASSPVLIFQKK